MKAGKWYRGVLEAAERFVVKWHEDEADLSRQHRAIAVGGAQGNGKRGDNRRSGRKLDQGREQGGQQEEWKETRPRMEQGGQQEECKGNRGGRK